MAKFVEKKTGKGDYSYTYKDGKLKSIYDLDTGKYIPFSSAAAKSTARFVDKGYTSGNSAASGSVAKPKTSSAAAYNKAKSAITGASTGAVASYNKAKKSISGGTSAAKNYAGANNKKSVAATTNALRSASQAKASSARADKLASLSAAKSSAGSKMMMTKTKKKKY